MFSANNYILIKIVIDVCSESLDGSRYKDPVAFVRVVGDEVEPNIYPLDEALRIAGNLELDLGFNSRFFINFSF